MGYLRVKLWDVTGTKRLELEVPDDKPVRAILSSVVTKMNLPEKDRNGMPLVYKMIHKSSGRQLMDQQTFASAGVKNNDVVRVLAEMVAGNGI